MGKKLKIAALFFMITFHGFALEEEIEEFIEETTKMLAEIGNKICPITGEEIKTAHVYVHNGKSYNLCCSMCVKPFAEDPEKYAAIAEQEVSMKKE